MALTALALILGAAPALWRSFREAPQPTPQQVAQLKVEKPTWAPEASAAPGSAPSPYLPTSPSPHPSSPHLPIAPSPHLAVPGTKDVVDVTVGLSKAGKNVELAWTGSPQKEYVVYRCTSPKFDQCSVAGTVKGNQWNDTGSDSAPVVFYKVEPKA